MDWLQTPYLHYTPEFDTESMQPGFCSGGGRASRYFFQLCDMGISNLILSSFHIPTIPYLLTAICSLNPMFR